MTQNTPATAVSSRGLFGVPDLRLLIYALIGIVVVGIIITLLAPITNAPELSIHSETPQGAMALQLWLERSGYKTAELREKPITRQMLGTHNVLFILNPAESYTLEEVQTIRDWVRQGRTLIVAGRWPYAISILSAFLVTQQFIDPQGDTVAASSPTLLSPPLDLSRAEPIYSLDSPRRDMVVHVFSGSYPVLVSLPEARGKVWVSGMLVPFSNRGLKDPGNARLILNMLGDLPRGASILFDESRHGSLPTDERTISAWLWNTPPGWGVLLAIALIMVFLAMQGRRFGRAVPVPEERLLREPVEYIQAIANLFRRSGQRTDMLQHYRHQFRRRLVERYGIDSNLNDRDLVLAIQARDPSVNVTALADLLRRLDRQPHSERELIAAALDVDTWLRQM